MNKEQAIKIIVSAAKDYKSQFAGKNHLYIYNKNNKLCSIEVSFPKGAFLHLTGVETSLNARQFYDKCITSTLSPRDFEFKADGTTELKMRILPKLFKINQTYKMIGAYNNLKPKLYTERLAGGQFCCIGLVSDNSGFYVPNTALNEDIRDLTAATYRIMAIYSKPINKKKYTERLYLANKVSSDKIEGYVEQICPLR